LTSIFTLADATKLKEKFKLSKDFDWADYVQSFKIDSTQSARNTLHSQQEKLYIVSQYPSFENLIFEGILAMSASVKIDVNDFVKIISSRLIFSVYQ
jgi:hypothetical protein